MLSQRLAMPTPHIKIPDFTLQFPDTAEMRVAESQGLLNLPASGEILCQTGAERRFWPQSHEAQYSSISLIEMQAIEMQAACHIGGARLSARAQQFGGQSMSRV